MSEGFRAASTAVLSCDAPAHFPVSLDNLSVSPIRFQNPICLFSPWFLLGASPLVACLLLLVFTKCVPSPISASVPPLTLSALSDLPPLGTSNGYDLRIPRFDLCLTPNYFKGACLVSPGGSQALQEAEPLSDSKPLLHQYFILVKERVGVEAPGSGLCWGIKTWRKA